MIARWTGAAALLVALTLPQAAAPSDHLTSLLIRGDRFVAAYERYRLCVMAGGTTACGRDQRTMERILIAGGIAPETAQRFLASLLGHLDVLAPQ